MLVYVCRAQKEFVWNDCNLVKLSSIHINVSEWMPHSLSFLTCLFFIRSMLASFSVAYLVLPTRLLSSFVYSFTLTRNDEWSEWDKKNKMRHANVTNYWEWEPKLMLIVTIFCENTMRIIEFIFEGMLLSKLNYFYSYLIL